MLRHVQRKIAIRLANLAMPDAWPHDPAATPVIRHDGSVQGVIDAVDEALAALPDLTFARRYPPIVATAVRALLRAR